MVSFAQLLIAAFVQLVIGFVLGWFVNEFRRQTRGPLAQSAPSARPAQSDRPAHSPAPPKSNQQVLRDVPDTQTRLLADIASLVNQHAESVECFQCSIEQVKGPTPRNSRVSLSSQVSQLRQENSRFDENVDGKVSELAESSTSDSHGGEFDVDEVTDSVNGHRDKTRCLDDLLGKADPHATADELKDVISEALSDVLESKKQLENELSDVIQKLEEKTVRLNAAEQDARVDSLTRLPNRRAFEEQAAAAHSMFERQGRPYALLMFDIDHFKLFNDTYGHAAGDAVLKTVARLLNEKKRASDNSFRLGGEEFVMLLRSASVADAHTVAERARKTIEDMVVIFEGQKLNVTTSVGLAAIEDGVTTEQLLDQADIALYAAKKAGRNQTHGGAFGTPSSPISETETAQSTDADTPVGV